MNCRRPILSAVALLSLTSVQSGCITQPNWIQVSSNDWPRKPTDLARFARCDEIEVAIANSSGSILYGDSFPDSGILGFVLGEDEVDKASLGRIRDRVGETFAEHLRRAFPDKKVLHYTKGPDFSAPRFDSPGHDADRSAVCLLSYTYIIHPPRPKMPVVGSIWAKYQKTLAGTLAVIESSPPLLLPRAQAFVPGMGWGRDKAFWVANRGGGTEQGSGSQAEYPLDCTAEVEVDVRMPSWTYPKKVRVDYASCESTILKWANRRASDVADQLGKALTLNAHDR